MPRDRGARRYAAGIAGLLVLGLVTWWARRQDSSLRLVLGAPVAAIAGTVAFAAAALIMTGLGVNAVRFDHRNGTGQWFSAAGVAVVAVALLAIGSVPWVQEPPGHGRSSSPPAEPPAIPRQARMGPWT